MHHEIQTMEYNKEISLFPDLLRTKIRKNEYTIAISVYNFFEGSSWLLAVSMPKPRLPGHWTVISFVCVTSTFWHMSGTALFLRCTEIQGMKVGICLMEWAFIAILYYCRINSLINTDVDSYWTDKLSQSFIEGTMAHDLVKIPLNIIKVGSTTNLEL